MDTKPLAGKTALVTGAARNIGRAIALSLADAGANIIVNTLQDQQAADAVAGEITQTGADSIVCVADVTDRDAVFAMAEAGRDKFGAVDILILNASARGQVNFLDMTHEDWRRVIDISLDGAFHCAQAALPMMIERGWGRVVALGGISWHAGFPRRANNLAGKAGLTGFTRALAAEFGDRGITANVVAPGSIDTVRPASAGALPPRESLPPVPRMGTVEEIASATRFLCMPEQAYLTGQVIHVNGGAYLGT
ncbi:MAG: SDR family oxidoreductase [Hyphomicrobiaceae bacterium]|nr:SDR family oxidoreductase [Hyphomicrobiaceae bacterium]